MRGGRGSTAAIVLVTVVAALGLGAMAATLPSTLVIGVGAATLGAALVTRPDALLLASVATTVVVNAGYLPVLGRLRFALLILLLFVLCERSRRDPRGRDHALRAGVCVAVLILIYDSATRFQLDEGVQRSLAMTVLLLITLVLARARHVEALTRVWSQLFTLLIAFILIGTFIRPAVTMDSVTLTNVLRGPFDNPNALGLLAGASTVWVLGRENKQLSWLLVPVMFALLLASESRGALLGTIVAAVMMGRSQHRVLSVAGAAVAIFVVSSPLSLLAGLENNERIGAWRVALSAVWQTPFSGIGFGNTETALEMGALRLPLEFQGQHLHNSYIEVLYELGLVPGLLFLGAVVIVLLASVRRAPTSGPLRFLRPLIVFGVISAFAESWMFATGSIFALVFWVAVGTAWARPAPGHGAVLANQTELQPAERAR